MTSYNVISACQAPHPDRSYSILTVLETAEPQCLRGARLVRNGTGPAICVLQLSWPEQSDTVDLWWAEIVGKQAQGGTRCIIAWQRHLLSVSSVWTIGRARKEQRPMLSAWIQKNCMRPPWRVGYLLSPKVDWHPWPRWQSLSTDSESVLFKL
jgi:hypothetical protein